MAINFHQAHAITTVKLVFWVLISGPRTSTEHSLVKWGCEVQGTKLG